MLAKISKQFVIWQIARGTLKTEEQTIYQYAYEILLGQIINIALAGVIAWLFNDVVTVLIFLLAYMPLRSFAGGLHADNHLSCSIISTVILGMVCFFSDQMKAGYFIFWYPAFFAVSGLVIFSSAPVQDKNKPLDYLEIRKYGKISRILWLSETVVGICLYFTFYEQGAVLAICHGIIAIMLILGRIKNK